MEQAFMCGFKKHASFKNFLQVLMPETERDLLAQAIKQIRKNRDIYSRSSREAFSLAQETRQRYPGSNMLERMLTTAKENQLKSQELSEQAKSMLTKAAGKKR